MEGEDLVVNIGMTPHVDSPYCSIYKKGVLSRVSLIKKLKRISDQFDVLIVPNRNSIVSNVLISAFKEKTVIQVTEGTLNYHQRPEESLYKEWFKKILLLFYFEKYYRVQGDPLDHIASKDGGIICRSEVGLVTNNKNIIKVNNLKVENKKKNNFLYIVGQHIIEKSSDFVGLSNIKCWMERNSLCFDEIFYIKHPRSKFDVEYRYLTEGIDCKVIDNKTSAYDICTQVPPSHVIALGGSTLFLELSDFIDIKRTALGIDFLISKGFSQYRQLRDFHENIGVNIYE